MLRPRLKLLLAAIFVLFCVLHVRTFNRHLEGVDFTILFQAESTWLSSSDVDPKFLKQIGCPVQNCFITRNSASRTIRTFDMVLFLAENGYVRHVRELEAHRSPEQIYGITILEPPHYVYDLQLLDNKMNWTLGYRSDADVRWDYGTLNDKETGEVMPRDPVWRTFDERSYSEYLAKSDIPELVRNKSKMVAWFVSNCAKAHVTSHRMELALAINQYIPVDIYGKCGTLECSRGDENKCNEMLERDYKFYFSFENSLCKDYITEKTFNIMKRMIIPVIYSGAEVETILPPNSYINAEDFATAEELANYLLFLADNPKEYIKYFWWKEFYVIGGKHFSCNICQKLNEKDPFRQIGVKKEIGKWFYEGTCREPRIKF